MPSFLSDLRHLKEGLNSPDQVERSIAEMAQQYYAKEAKLSVAQKALMQRDLQRLIQADHDDVRRFKAKHLWPQDEPSPTQGDDMGGDIIVCDDYHHNDKPPDRPAGGLAKALLAGAALAAAGVGGWLLDRVLHPPAVPAPSTAQETVRKIESREGFNLELVPPEAENGKP